MKRLVVTVIALYIALNACVLVYRSTWFGKSAGISRVILEQLDNKVQDLPAGTPVLLVNLPDHLGYTFTFRNTFPAAAKVLKYDFDIEMVLDSKLAGLSSQEQKDYVNQLRKTSNTVVFWYRNGKLVTPGADGR